MSGEFWAAIVGAIVGSLSAGFITWSLQRNQDHRQTLDRNKALARSLIFKLMRIHSDMYGFQRHVEDSASNARRDKLEEGWRSLRAIGNLPERVSFSSEEMSYLLSLGKLDLFNQVLSLDVIHSSTIGIFELYKERRLALTDLLSASMLEGTVGTCELNDTQMAFFAPKFTELDLLASDIRSRAESDSKNSLKALQQTAVAVRVTLGQNFSLEFEQPSNAPAGGTP